MLLLENLRQRLRLSNIDQAKEFLKKNLNCKSQIRSIKQFLLSI